MNISSSVDLSQLSSTSEQGGAARQDYSVAVALKVRDQIKQEGADAEKLVESAPQPSSDETRGKNLSTYA
jgi:hypothetical protein